MTTAQLEEYANAILTKTVGLYGSKMVNKKLPKIVFEEPSFFHDKKERDEDNTLLLFAKRASGLAVRDEWIKKYIREHNLTEAYPDGTVFIFKNENCKDDNKILSTLCHELMHFFFLGINNETDAGQGFNEACTDYLAEQLFGEGYSTDYKQNSPKIAYMDYYWEFMNGSEEYKQALLDLYMGIPVDNNN